MIQLAEFLYWFLWLLASFCLIADMGYIYQRNKADLMLQRHHCEVMIFFCTLGFVSLLMFILFFERFVS